MGMDGGVNISKIKDIKEGWVKIKSDLIRNLEQYEKSSKWSVNMQEVQQAKDLPDNIDDYSGQQIVEMFQFLASCDCPYCLDDTYILTGDGDNVPDCMNSLSMALPGISIETWT